MITTNTPQTEIARMFLAPDTPCPDQGRPLLYLLRRDLQNQYGKETDPPGRLLSPLLTALGIMVGFEVATKLWSGNHLAGRSTMEQFLKTIVGLPPDKAAAMTQFRHALAHGYKFQTIDRRKQLYTFSISDTPSETELIRDNGSNNFSIDGQIDAQTL